ncbi:MAG TPA: DUF2911 domain-containing protein [Candidatus Binatia bacterium]|nr:DUF2911 domain-containing protein [Candidatus Binatia bacterium]
MKQQLAFCISILGLLVAPSFSQQLGTSSSATCTFQDGKQLSVQHEKIPPIKKVDLSSGKLWTPGEKPMVLFTQADLNVGHSEIPVGAYSLYFIPGKDHWTLVVNKGVEKGQYEQQQDLVRVAMDVGQLSTPEQFSLLFAHVAPKQCNLRIYEGKTGAWAEFHEK